MLVRVYVSVCDQGAGRGVRRGRPAVGAYPKLVYFNEVDRGNHFAAWQEPVLFAREVRAAFRSLRWARGSAQPTVQEIEPLYV